MDAFQTISLVLDVLAGVLGAWGLSLLWRSAVALRRRGVAVCPQCAAEVAGASPTACDKCGGKIPKRRWPARRRRAGVMDLAAGIVAAVLAFGVLIGSAYAESWAKDQFQPINWWVALAKLGVWSLGAGAVWLVVSGLVGRRSGGKPHCHKCWYLMEGVPDLTCPECGKVAASKRELFRSKRKWKRVIVGGAMLPVLVYGVWAMPRVSKGGWVGAVPTWVLIWQMERMPSEWLVDTGYSRDEDFSLAGRLEREGASEKAKRWALNRGIRAAMATNDVVRGEVYSDVAFAGLSDDGWDWEESLTKEDLSARTVDALWTTVVDTSRPKHTRLGAIMWLQLSPATWDGREEAVLTLLEDSDEEVWTTATNLLQHVPSAYEPGLERILTRLRAGVASSVQIVYVGFAAGELSGQNYPTAIEIVEFMLAMPRRDQIRAGLVAVRLATQGGNGAPFVPTVKALARHTSPDIAMDAGRALTRIESVSREELLEVMRHNIGQPGPSRAEWVTLLMGYERFGSTLVTTLELAGEFWSNLGPGEREDVARNLMYFVLAQPKSRTVLGELQQHESAEVRAVADEVVRLVKENDAYWGGP